MYSLNFVASTEWLYLHCGGCYSFIYLLCIYLFLFLGHTCQCSNLIPGYISMDHWGSRQHMWCQKLNRLAIHHLTDFLLYYLSFLVLFFMTKIKLKQSKVTMQFLRWKQIQYLSSEKTFSEYLSLTDMQRSIFFS